MMLQMLAALLLLASASVAPSGSPAAARTGLDVPIVVQAPERCGQAALEMVLRYYGADSAALHEADRAYDPALRGSLITDLAAAARRAGYEATIATLAPDSLIALLVASVPPIVLYQNGRAPLTAAHFGVVIGWDPARETFTLNDGGVRSRAVGRDNLAKRWRTAGSQALIIRRRSP
jgi:ABC-type bacteriocin/lantibiotic exporter with double-glycine peptidase domain